MIVDVMFGNLFFEPRMFCLGLTWSERSNIGLFHHASV
jgi:hypothetical protein